MKVRDLRDAVAAGRWPTDPIEHVPYIPARLAFEGSTDAAIELVREVLPGWGWHLQDRWRPPGPVGTVFLGRNLAFEGRAATPGRALLLAVLEAAAEYTMKSD